MLMERRVELEVLRNGSREKGEQIASQVMRDLQGHQPIPALTVDKAIEALKRSKDFFDASEEYERQRVEEINRSR